VSNREHENAIRRLNSRPRGIQSLCRPKGVTKDEFDETLFTDHRNSSSLFELHCPDCGAFYFKLECYSARYATFCGVKHDIKLPTLIIPSEDSILFELLTTQTAKANFFRKNIYSFNKSFAMISMTTKVPASSHNDGAVMHGNGQAPPVIKIGGSVQRRMGALVPSDANAPVFGQIYFYSSADFDPAAARARAVKLETP
jgi:hypothetical protein